MITKQIDDKRRLICTSQLSLIISTRPFLFTHIYIQLWYAQILHNSGLNCLFTFKGIAVFRQETRQQIR